MCNCVLLVIVFHTAKALAEAVEVVATAANAALVEAATCVHDNDGVCDIFSLCMFCDTQYAFLFVHQPVCLKNQTMQ